jgi:NAD+-dependent protein deacetylase SIR2
LFRSLKGQHKLKSSGRDLFDASVYKDDKSTTQFHDMVRSLAKMTQSANPSPFHQMLATMAQQDRLLRLYSQNVDGIDTQLPPLATQVPLNRKAPWPKTVQLHGNLEKMICSKCRHMSDLNAELFDGPLPPLCQHCVENDDVRTKHAGKRSHGVGRLRPRMVLYNEHNPDDEAIGAVVKADLLKRPDALIVVGTSLKVPGVKRIVREMCGVVRGRKDGLTIWINNDPPPLVKDFEWDLIVKGPCDEVAHRACMRQWDRPEEEKGEAATAEQVQKVQETSKLEVLIMSPSKTKTFERIQGVVTPVSSPRLTPFGLQTQSAPRDAAAQAEIKPTAAKGGKKATAAKPKAPKPPKANGRKTMRQTASAKAAAGNAKINQAFTVSKSTAQIQIPKAKQSEGHPGAFVEVKTPANFYGPQTPTQLPMQPVSPSAVRNNSSPPFAPPVGKDWVGDGREVAKQRTLSLETSCSGKESPEERRRTISPTGPLPKGMAKLLDLA